MATRLIKEVARFIKIQTRTKILFTGNRFTAVLLLPGCAK